MFGRQDRGSSSQQTGPEDKNWFSRWQPPAQMASKATDLDSLRSAVVDAAGVGYGLWFSYLFALLYFAIAAGAVTHRDLLLENPVKLPFLNVELPLNAFFILGPLVFLVVHAYVLLHFLLLAGKVGAFHAELQRQVPENEKRAQLRRQLPSNIFVQFLAGPREVRTGIVGFLLKSVATISLVAGPIALLILFQLQFLPYHSPPISWWQRIAVVLDLVLLWLLWPPIARGETTLLGWKDLGRLKVAAWLPASLLPLLLVFAVATFPGEWLEQQLYGVAPVNLTTGEPVQTHWWAWPHKLSVAGDVDYGLRRPESLWSNRLVLPDFDIGDRLKFDAEGKLVHSRNTISLRVRRLEGAVLVHAQLRRADFTGATLDGANFYDADLREAEFVLAQLQGARFFNAQLRGASFARAQLQGAFFDHAQLQGAAFDLAQLQGAAFDSAQLQGALLVEAHLEGAELDGAQLQGATLDGARLQEASLGGVFVWRTRPPAPPEKYLTGALIEMPRPEPVSGGYACPPPRKLECSWSEAVYAALKARIETVPAGFLRDEALKLIEPLREGPYEADAKSAKDWRDLAAASQSTAEAYPGELAKRLITIGCAADGAPFVVGRLINQLDYRFRHSRAQMAVVADAFLDEAKCPGARGLSEDYKARLRRVRGPDTQ
jgi:hypothetical protein